MRFRSSTAEHAGWRLTHLLLCLLALFPQATMYASSERSLSDSLEVLRLLDEAIQPCNVCIMGSSHDPILSARALELAERIGWDRGVFKGHLWSLFSIAEKRTGTSGPVWDLHLSEATKLRGLASHEEAMRYQCLMSRSLMVAGRSTHALLHLDTAQWAAERSGDKVLLAWVAYSRAHVIRNAERWGEAFRAVLVSKSMADRSEDDLLKAANYNLSGMIRGRLGDLDGAVKDFTTSLAISDGKSLHILRVMNHVNWAYVMQVKGRWREALDHYRLLLGVVLSTGESKDRLAEYETGIGYMLVRLDSLDAAEVILERLHRTKAMVGDPYEQEFNNAWALLQLRRGRYQQAISAANTAFVTEQGDENDVIKRDASHILAEAFKALNDPRQALKWVEVNHQWKDSVLYRAQANTAIRMEAETKFATQAEQDSISNAETRLLLDHERTEARTRDIEHRKQRIILIVLIAFVILYAGILFIRARTNRRIQLEQLRNRLSRDLHDDIGSTLSSINILSTVARRKAETGDEAGAAASLAGIGERTQRLMRNMSDIVWSVDPERDTLEELLVRMREFGASVLEPKGISYRFDSTGELGAAMSPMVKSNLYLIFKEAVNNAAKHAEATAVIATFTHENNRLRMTISDNGKGLDQRDASTNTTGGNGLRNMRTRAAEMKAELRMESTPGSGTTIELVVPFQRGLPLKRNHSEKARPPSTMKRISRPSR